MISVIDDILFKLKRVFFLESGNSKSTRGGHAHKKCTQVFSLITGNAQLIATDNFDEITLSLFSDSTLILVPPGIWLDVEIEPFTKIMVLCDMAFDEADYIRNWTEFKMSKI